ncbi:citrinin biosynthesis oxydoreductase CtnB, partial [Metarhizium majus ARSEF 297]
MTVDDTLSLPRILCLHGGGVNGTVFRLQCRAIIAQLGHRFRFVFMDAPYTSRPHRDIVTVYGDFAPFYRWLAWSREEPGLPPWARAGDVMDATDFTDYPDPEEAPPRGLHVLRLPTLHVHGLQDPGIQRHRCLLERYCAPATARLVQWDAGHRLPVKTADVKAVVAEVLRLARETGAIPPDT